eukprot:10810895-Alexandrium_andersonii.AAC.1
MKMGGLLTSAPEVGCSAARSVANPPWGHQASNGLKLHPRSCRSGHSVLLSALDPMATTTRSAPDGKEQDLFKSPAREYSKLEIAYR